MNAKRLTLTEDYVPLGAWLAKEKQNKHCKHKYKHQPVLLVTGNDHMRAYALVK